MTMEYYTIRGHKVNHDMNIDKAETLVNFYLDMGLKYIDENGCEKRAPMIVNDLYHISVKYEGMKREYIDVKEFVDQDTRNVYYKKLFQILNKNFYHKPLLINNVAKYLRYYPNRIYRIKDKMHLISISYPAHIRDRIMEQALEEDFGISSKIPWKQKRNWKSTISELPDNIIYDTWQFQEQMEEEEFYQCAD